MSDWDLLLINETYVPFVHAAVSHMNEEGWSDESDEGGGDGDGGVQCNHQQM